MLTTYPVHIHDNDMYSDLIGPNQEKDQKLRDELIKAATDGLQQQSLLNKYKSLMSDLVVMQSKIEILRIDITASVKAIESKEGQLSQPLLVHFEKRYENHQSDLKHLTYLPHVPLSPSSSTTSFSQSSIEYSPTSSTHSLTQPDHLTLASEDDPSHQTVLSLASSHAFLDHSPTPSELHQDHLSTSSSLPLHPPNSRSNERNALDDTLDFLDTLSVDDGGFRKDLLNLLDRYEKPQKKKRCFLRRSLNTLALFTWQWIRFMMVMSLAILISLRQRDSEQRSRHAH
ncbi:hypothetical protein G6F60_005821 [Rhizopus arrhizus]|nr:hypothetical protein G6F61_005249 [Rhizopus arrhizus]KAG1402270.1 hypothetical protein G6F60_005821 [Rhizopus arrhizus]